MFVFPPSPVIGQVLGVSRLLAQGDAPNCDWSQAHSDSYIAYVSSGQNWTATINNKTFTHTRNGQSHQDTRINYESGSTSYWAKVK